MRKATLHVHVARENISNGYVMMGKKGFVFVEKEGRGEVKVSDTKLFCHLIHLLKLLPERVR